MYVRMLGPTGPHRAVIDKILRGTKTAEIPVEQPTKFELTINIKAAKAVKQVGNRRKRVEKRFAR